MKSIELFKILIWRAIEFLKFYWRAKNRYNIHSTRIYDLCRHILDDKRRFYLFGDIDTWREQLKHSREELNPEDFGAGSQGVSDSGSRRSIRQIYHSCSSPEFKGKWLARLVWWWKAKNILELGTCLGVGSAYLAGASKQAKYTGIEGSKMLSDYSREALLKIGAPHAKVLNGRFEDLLPGLLEEFDYDLVFVDGNHTKKATLYYDTLLRQRNNSRCLLIYDDIYWNPEMKAAWERIKLREGNDLCIDLFFVGIVFINSSMFMKPQHFSLIPFSWKPLAF